MPSESETIREKVPSQEFYDNQASNCEQTNKK